MSDSLTGIDAFLAGRWSRPIRRACPHLSAQVQERVDPTLPTPRWAQPEYLQWLLADAITERMTWQARQPGEVRYCYGRLSEPCWEEALRMPYTPQYRHGPGTSGLLSHMSQEVERMYRIARTAPSDVSETLWMLTLLRSCRELARLFSKLKRRCGAPRARELLGQVLGIFVDWQAGEAA